MRAQLLRKGAMRSLWFLAPSAAPSASRSRAAAESMNISRGAARHAQPLVSGALLGMDAWTGEQKAERLAVRLAGLAVGLGFRSEIVSPFLGLSRPAVNRDALTLGDLRQALAVPDGATVRVRSFDDYFAIMREDCSADAGNAKAAFERLEQAMRMSLTELQVLYVDDPAEIDSRVYLLGRTADGYLVGLESRCRWD